jgi:hypothetical protein
MRSIDRREFLLMILVAALMMAATKASPQNKAENVQPKLSKNCITFSLSNREHFDGSPYMQPRYFGRRGWMKLGMGLEYSRMIGSQSGLSLSINSLLANYYIDAQNPLQVGDVVRRDGGLLELDYNRKLATLGEWPVYGLLGFNYRFGYESVFVYEYFSEIKSTWYILKEPGISVGLRTSRHLFWRLELNGLIKFTQFFLRYDDGSAHGDHYFNRSTRNMLTMQLGLGFRF